ncbi:hypothetical protein TraAM80_06393 [Trypanosoma rangeli]|uniref:Uncharacterized protein n=1 Tax=Trypanosoma rangeli TaxID=5698 RepID=A0A3R7K6D4_TRYRA|nr:uncharacterized protein TraAM80_06393 [Trypanosoma rangeli]RNF02496.1 hypothetical protein TraAM80_06393 [Trypanosoma rangeli]|eukprot:RNF02496.1 hypothetical protein TraAM80_06393 [Trypanosoma rangeli]
MILPGVYMLRGCTASSQGRQVVSIDASRPQLEFILDEIEAMERHVKKLRESNDEIRGYLRSSNSVTECKNALSTSGTEILVCDTEDINTVLTDALRENEVLISSKEQELNELKKMVQSNRCACSYHLVRESGVKNSVPGDASSTVSPEVGEAADEMSNAHFLL